MSEEFKLDRKTQALIDEGLSFVDAQSPRDFEEKARLLVAFLRGKGLRVERDETFGDVLYTTPEGWGVTVLFNEQARKQADDAVW